MRFTVKEIREEIQADRPPGKEVSLEMCSEIEKCYKRITNLRTALNEVRHDYSIDTIAREALNADYQDAHDF